MKLYLENSCRIGYSTFNNPHRQQLPPESSSKQLYRLTDNLLNLKAGTDSRSENPLLETIQHSKPYFCGNRPLSFVITFTKRKTDNLEEGLRKLVCLSGKLRQPDGVVLVNLLPSPYDMEDEVEKMACRFEKIEHEIILENFMSNVKKVNWSPGHERINKIFMELLS